MINGAYALAGALIGFMTSLAGVGGSAVMTPRLLLFWLRTWLPQVAVLLKFVIHPQRPHDDVCVAELRDITNFAHRFKFEARCKTALDFVL